MTGLAIAGHDIRLLRAIRRSLIAIIACLLMAGAIRVSHAAGADIVATGFQFTEGTIFVGNTLYFVDYSASSVLRLTGNKVETVWHQNGCGANGLLQVPRGCSSPATTATRLC
jgi:hypothetical protein